MRAFNTSCVLVTLTLLTGCQSFQFVDSPIPVITNPVIVSPVIAKINVANDP
ncbi:hypothetical protein [Psychrobacter frigidicola]|uniref:hypothetical protein n=1 Tax=Psychrobacter frigidicola TaxID=45611 RepID=UPI00191B7D19|nr:hypothetical protein [Psychrobacter frigidicola]